MGETLVFAGRNPLRSGHLQHGRNGWPEQGVPVALAHVDRSALENDIFLRVIAQQQSAWAHVVQGVAAADTADVT